MIWEILVRKEIKEHKGLKELQELKVQHQVHKGLKGHLVQLER